MEETQYYYVPVMIHMNDGRIIEAGHSRLTQRQYLEFIKRTKDREYFQNIKDKLNKKHSCNVCGGRYTKANISKHNITLKHRKAAAFNSSC